MRMRHFLAQNGPFAPNKNFLGKIFIIIFIDPFHCAEFWKKFLQWIQSYEDAPFFGPKWPIYPNDIFFRNLLINLVPFIHAYLHSRNQIQISIY